MSIATRVRVVRGMLCGIMVLSCVGVAIGAQYAGGADSPSGNVMSMLISGSPQVILAVCLLGVTGALGVSFRLLVKSYLDRINALEAHAVRVADTERANVELARAIDALRIHCADMNRRHG